MKISFSLLLHSLVLRPSIPTALTMLRFALLGRRALPLLRRQRVVATPTLTSFPRFLTSSLPLKDGEKTEEAAAVAVAGGDSSKPQKAKTGGGGGGMGGMTAQETDDWLSELE